ncbi:hypothetical protein NC653_007798 [Populus alba x Populus x berolinensis]|uniref:Uncharacterized protein n=1 Tax=Populus alba x Populus x berolinensis TaxID=444605 RepID=A0AAD6W7Q1_9ROSI|nr:hypothetical protein NC653_007798 [Populus alba x Populus x berolinensis]
MGISAVGSRRKMFCAIQKLGKGVFLMVFGELVDNGSKLARTLGYLRGNIKSDYKDSEKYQLSKLRRANAIHSVDKFRAL